MTAVAPGVTGIRIPALVPGSPEWLLKMSASKIAAVLGLSPYESRFSLWHRMAGNVPQQADNDVLRRGHYLEPAIAAWFADQHPEFTVIPGWSWQHPEEERFTASPDRLLVLVGPDEARGLEIKTAADSDEWGQEGTDEIPIGYKAQALWQMDVVGTRITHFAVLTAYLEFREYVVEYDPAEAAFIRERAAAFLDSLPGGPLEQAPDLDSHSATYEAVRALHPGIERDFDVQLDYDLARRYCTARTVLAAAETEERMCKSLVLDVMGDARRARWTDKTIATRQARGEGLPYLVAGRSLPTFEDQS